MQSNRDDDLLLRDADQLCYARQGEWSSWGGLFIDRLKLRDLIVEVAIRAADRALAKAKESADAS